MVVHVDPEARGDERGALLAFLDAERGGVRRALLGLSDEAAATRPSASELSLAGLLKHVRLTEQGWLALAAGSTPAPAEGGTYADEEHGFELAGEETVASELAAWDAVARRTEEFIRGAELLDATFPLPEAPWFPPGQQVSLRWLLLRLITEMSRHAGHADIIRESLDGATAFALVARERGEEWG
ncbi:DinB family protein [Streptomyces sp. BBFR102]|uniref:DinB family protein n=1 Tax=Streptomyces sp. BBFR102 TaxID=3448171 RepID=UPI003F52DD44